MMAAGAGRIMRSRHGYDEIREAVNPVLDDLQNRTDEIGHYPGLSVRVSLGTVGLAGNGLTGADDERMPSAPWLISEPHALRPVTNNVTMPTVPRMRWVIDQCYLVS